MVGFEYLMRAFHDELFGENTLLQLNQTRMRKSGEMENVRMNEKNKSGKKKSGKQNSEIPANEQFVADYLDELSFYWSGHFLIWFFKMLRERSASHRILSSITNALIYILQGIHRAYFLIEFIWYVEFKFCW